MNTCGWLHKFFVNNQPYKNDISDNLLFPLPLPYITVICSKILFNVLPIKFILNTWYVTYTLDNPSEIETQKWQYCQFCQRWQFTKNSIILVDNASFYSQINYVMLIRIHITATFEFSYISKFSAKSWQNPASIDIQWAATIYCQCWLNSASNWQKIWKYSKNSIADQWIVFSFRVELEHNLQKKST